MKKNPFKDLKKILLLKEKIDYYVVFKIENIYYALKTDAIKEILPYKEKKEMPNTPGYIVGVVDNNNIPIILIDLKKLMNDNENQDFDKNCIIINFVFENKNYGFFTKEIIDIIPVDKASLNEVGEEMKKIYFVDNVFSYEGNVVLVINLEKILLKKESDEY